MELIVLLSAWEAEGGSFPLAQPNLGCRMIQLLRGEQWRGEQSLALLEEAFQGSLSGELMAR